MNNLRLPDFENDLYTACNAAISLCVEHFEDFRKVNSKYSISYINEISATVFNTQFLSAHPFSWSEAETANNKILEDFKILCADAEIVFAENPLKLSEFRNLTAFSSHSSTADAA